MEKEILVFGIKITPNLILMSVLVSKRLEIKIKMILVHFLKENI